MSWNDAGAQARHIRLEPVYFELAMTINVTIIGQRVGKLVEELDCATQAMSGE